MLFHRRTRLAGLACRLPFTTCLFALLVGLAAAPSASAANITGQIVDASGRPVPRAYVQVLDDSATVVSAGFADEVGRFTLTAPLPCHVTAALSGFQTASQPCGADAPMRIELALAPIRENIVVSATRTPAPASQVAASFTVFTEEDLIRAQKPLVADLLMRMPGAMLMRNGGPGGVTSLFVRGGESDYNKILLDGVPLNEPGGTYYLSNLSTENLERIEIVRGAYSTLFGSDAMASVIQLFTKRPASGSEKPHVSAQVDGGTYGSIHASAGVTGARNGWSYSFGAARLNTDNRVPNSALGNTTLSANVSVALSQTATLGFVGRGELEHVGTPGPTAFGRPDLDAFFERHDGVSSIRFEQQMGRLVQRASYSLALSNQTSQNRVADPSYTATYQGRVGVFRSSDFLNDSLTSLERHHANYQADVTLANGPSTGSQTLTVLADWDGERATVNNRLAKTETANTRDNLGFAAQQQMLWPRLFVTLGGRLERIDGFGTAFVPGASVVYVVHETSGSVGETRVKASAGTGVKEPTMLESFSASPFFRGNPDLKPERSRSAEIGIEQRLAMDRARIEISYFDNHFRDVISLLTTNPETFEGKYFNVGVTRARGLELGIEIAPTSMIRAHGSYTRLDGKVLESSSPNDRVFGLGRELFRRPKNSGSLGVSVSAGRVEADLDGTFVGRFVDSDFGLFSPSFLESPGHKIWDARIAVTITPKITGILGIDNLTDRDYSEPLGYQALRRAARVGLRVAF